MLIKKIIGIEAQQIKKNNERFRIYRKYKKI